MSSNSKIGVYERVRQSVETYGSHIAGVRSVSRMVLVHGGTDSSHGGAAGVRAVRLSLPHLTILEKEPPSARSEDCFNWDKITR